MPEKVKKITKIEYSLEKRNPPNLVITVKGEVPTGGWHDAQLRRRTYMAPPSDGIWEYDLYAIPPDQPAPPMASEVEASHRWEGFNEQTVRGVRIYGVGDGVLQKHFGCS